MKTRILLFVGATSVLSLAALQANAQSVDYGALEQIFNEPVTTSATGSPSRASEAPVNMEILTQDDIRRSGATDLPGVLANVIGVDVDRTSVLSADVSVRGFNERRAGRLLVLVNGRQVYMDHFGFNDWGAIPVQLSEIRQIEVIRGPNTALFGFNAAGGVVNIITKNARYDDPKSILDLRAGSQNERAASLSILARANDRLSFRLSGGTLESDDFKTVANEAKSFDRALIQGTRVHPRRGEIALETRFVIADKQELLLEVTEQNTELVERYTYDSLGWTKLNFKSWKLGYSWDSPFGMAKATLYRNRSDMQQYSGIPYATRLNQVTVGQVEDTFKLGAKHTFRVAAEWRKNELLEGPATFFYNNYAIGGMWNWKATDALTLTTAVRYDNTQSERTGPLGPDGDPFPPLGNSAYSKTLEAVSYNFGVVYAINDLSSLRFSASRGIQPPSQLEWGTQGNGIVGNPNIKSTTVDNVEVGYSRALPKIFSTLKINVFGQRNEKIKRLYCFTALPNGLVAACNGGNADEWGADISLKGSNGPWNWSAAYAYQDIDTSDKIDFNAPENITRFKLMNPKNHFKALLGWTLGKWEIQGQYAYISERRYFNYNKWILNSQIYDPSQNDKLPARNQLSGRIAYKLNDHVTFAITGDNLAGPVQQESIVKTEQRYFATLRLSY